MATTDEVVGAAVGLDAFLAFYDATVVSLHRYLYRATAGDRALVDDLAQESYLAALARAKGGDPSVLTLPWLLAVSRNKLVDHFRRVERDARRAPVVSIGVVDGPAVGEDGALLGALRALPPLQRAAIALRYVDDLPVPEVARTLGKSMKATESLLSRGRAALRSTVVRDDHD